jgi:hypothetical protein
MTHNWKRAAKIFRWRALSFTEDWCDGYDGGEWCGRYQGAAVAFGLMGMATAIRQRCTCPVPYSDPNWPRMPDGRHLDWSEICERCKGYP